MKSEPILKLIEKAHTEIGFCVVLFVCVFVGMFVGLFVLFACLLVFSYVVVIFVGSLRGDSLTFDTTKDLKDLS